MWWYETRKFYNEALEGVYIDINFHSIKMQRTLMKIETNNIQALFYVLPPPAQQIKWLDIIQFKYHLLPFS